MPGNERALPDMDLVVDTLNAQIAPPPPRDFRFGRRTALWVPQFEWSEAGSSPGSPTAARPEVPRPDRPTPPMPASFAHGPGAPPLFAFKRGSDGRDEARTPTSDAFRWQGSDGELAPRAHPSGFRWQPASDGSGPEGEPPFRFKQPEDPGFSFKAQ